MKVAVLGSTAFSASDFIDYLLEHTDHEILGLSRSAEKLRCFLPHLRHGDNRYTFKQLHLFDDHLEIMTALDQFEPDYIVNFAAQGEVRASFEYPVDYYRTNCLATVMLCEELRKRDYLKKFVQISTPEIYGTCDKPVYEDQPSDPSSPYAASKNAADDFLKILHRQYGFPVCWVRATNVYGAYQQLYRIMPRTIIYFKLGKTLTLDGGGKAVKSYIHIRDISRAERSVMEEGRPGEIYHFSPDQGISIRSLVETIVEQMNANFDELVEVGPERPGQDKAYILNSDKARNEFGWAPEISMNEGLLSMIEWIDQYWDTIQAQPLDYIFKH